LFVLDILKIGTSPASEQSDLTEHVRPVDEIDTCFSPAQVQPQTVHSFGVFKSAQVFTLPPEGTVHNKVM
jgi:hypothetical protein